MQKRNYLKNKIKEIFNNYGYKEIKTPTFENLELFTAKSGQEIINEIYSFKDKGGRELALRPELTAPVMRFYVEKLQMEPKPLKLFYFGNCYRYDRPQKGRYREFTQAGCELIGTDSAEAYSELIAMAYNILKKSGLKKIKLNIGNLNILSYFLKNLKLSDEQKKYIIPLIDKSLFDELFDVLQEYGLNNKEISEFINILNESDFKNIRKLLSDNLNNELEKFEEICDLLKNNYKIDYQVKLDIVRGLDYYNGLVFEIEAPTLGAEKQICGGGVYDLIKLFGGKQTATAGFAIGFDRVLIAMEAEDFVFPKNKIDAYIIPYDKNMIKKSIEISELLRDNNLSVDIDLLRRGISKALKYANNLNSKITIIVGPEEIKEDSVSIKNMKTGKQEKIKIKKIINYFRSIKS